MKLKPEQLDEHLKRTLAPLYLVHGDEPLLAAEAADAVRAKARASGYTERLVLSVDAGFDWGVLREAAATLSLFAERRIIELRMPGGKPGETGTKALLDYAAAPPADNVLLIITGKLDSTTRNSRWVKGVEESGVALQVWPVDVAHLPGWIQRRMRAKGLAPTADAVRLLSERVEGNLLAAAQEIEKLALNPGPVDAEHILESVADSARFDIYELADSALKGEPRRTVRILEELRAAGTEPALVLWALTREIRALAGVAQGIARGEPAEALLRKHQIWDSRAPLFRQALKRRPPAHWAALLEPAGVADRIIKGLARGNIWDELLKLSLAISGISLLTAETP